MPWEQTAHEIRHRIRDPEDFREGTFRTKQLEGVSGDGITDLMADNVYMVLGKLKEDVARKEDRDPDSMVLQALRFRTEIEEVGEWVPTGWTMEKAKKWWDEHKDSFERSPAPNIERRAFQPVEVRVSDGSDGPRIVGHAAVFDQLSEPIGSFFAFRERIKKGAFKESIKTDDIRALWNHNPDWVLGRNRAGTLRLSEDDRGLAVEIDPPDTQWARDLLTSIRRGDVNQMSFGFQVLDETWGTENSESVRTLQRVRLFDVSVVTFPAYPQTDAAVRASIDRLAESIEALQRRLAAPVSSFTHRAGSKLEAARRRLRLLEVD